ncbi:sigma-70 family RNA polymerase sigma factor [Antarcticibacterium sp. 1MA-6-2]|uniref:RNA polymerase sigma factor n=1 Tax=Antarcticibacterium sp. 1MA-6-2 TaxID=2908210 RepID=UPI001F2AEAEE|nr:sigma-70 family RNA polymerase sigma factor [Antarcticibacterium sp. 1MA-6-2]UJH91994.1 sigma-70 family RNA polymerase sigma factor [Antarcticibacterium sp. 1MA-6-2]
MQEDQLIYQLQAGDEKAFEKVYQMYSRSLYGIIFNITRDETVSEEILQDVFMKIWDNASSYDFNKGRFFTWILNIARNASIDRLRSKDFKNKRSNIKTENFTDILESKSNTAGKLDAIGLQKYVDILEPVCKKLIDLLFFKGFTQKESAEELQIPLGTVKTRNRICIDKLRAYIVE